MCTTLKSPHLSRLNLWTDVTPGWHNNVVLTRTLCSVCQQGWSTCDVWPRLPGVPPAPAAAAAGGLLPSLLLLLLTRCWGRGRAQVLAQALNAVSRPGSMLRCAACCQHHTCVSGLRRGDARMSFDSAEFRDADADSLLGGRSSHLA